MSRHPRGFALLLVLWTLPLLTLIGTQLTASSRFETRLAANLRSAARAEAVADGSIRFAMFQLSSGAWRTDAAPRAVRIGQAVAIVTVSDHAGRIDPNISPAALVAALLREIGVPDDRALTLAQAMEQWRLDAPDLPALAARYHAASRLYAPTGKPFRTVAEIGLVLGMTPEILAALSPHLTVYRDTDPDPRLAGPIVRAALRASQAPVDQTRIGDPATRPLIAEIEATATDPGGATFTRRAVIRIAGIEPTNPRPWRILTWESGP